MNAQMQQLFEKFNALSERERISISLLIVVTICVIFFQGIISPLSSKVEIVDQQVSALQLQTSQLNKQLAMLKIQQTRDPDFQDKQKLKLVNDQIVSIDERLKEKMHGLIEPKQMAKMLEVVLTQNTDLKLQRVQSLGATPLATEKAKQGEAKESLGVFRHGLQIEFKGSYLSTLKYLQALNDLPWKFYWDSLELKVNKYPVSSIVITVHTLSFHEGWIGV